MVLFFFSRLFYFIYFTINLYLCMDEFLTMYGCHFYQCSNVPDIPELPRFLMVDKVRAGLGVVDLEAAAVRWR